MDLYIFGSYCRGEIDNYSDIDLLLIKDINEDLTTFDLDKFSIYNKKRINELWQEGNPFAWHLHLESKFIFSNTKTNYLKSLGVPNEYQNLDNDLNKFYQLYIDAKESLNQSFSSKDFDFSMIFLAIRNFASCYSLGYLKKPNFSRNSSLQLGEDSIQILNSSYSILEKARILSTRGIGSNILDSEFDEVVNEMENITKWFEKLNKKNQNE